MRIFISWSGDRSGYIADAIHGWLPLVINAVQPWLSAADLNGGTRWNLEVSKNLQESTVGIFCLTPENLDSTWLAFEAGAIAKSVDSSLACTYLYDVEPSQVRCPLAQFQAKVASRSGTFEMVRSINQAVNPPLLRPDLLTRAFEKWWPDLEAQLKAVPQPAAASKSQKREPSDLLEEILLMLRQQGREIPAAVARAADIAESRAIGVRSASFERQVSEYLRDHDSRLDRFRLVAVSPSSPPGWVALTISDRIAGKTLDINARPELLDNAATLASALQEMLLHHLPKDDAAESAG